MYILSFYENEKYTDLVAFNTIEEGRLFLKKIPGYEIEKIDGFEYEYINIDSFPEYIEVEFNGNIIPLTKFMFTEGVKVEVLWKGVPNISKPGNGMIDSANLVDAYSIPNKDLEEYIAKREDKYILLKSKLEERGYDVERTFFGSEDGEAIMYKKKDKSEWHFLTHMDPSFVYEKIDYLLEQI